MKKVILFGDSIRQGYEQYIKLAFSGKAHIYAPEDCTRFSSYLLRYLLQWKGEMQCGNDVDLIHWNAGLWDCLLMPDGYPHTDVDVYVKYLKRIQGILEQQFPNAKQVFATSTAVLEDQYVGIFRRLNRDINAYNTAAVAALGPCGVQINDLHALTETFPPSYYSDMTHFNTKDGTRILSNRVISCIEENLGIKADPLDFDQLFARQESIIGL